MMTVPMCLDKFSTVCCFYGTKTRKHHFEMIAATISSSAVVHVAFNNEYLPRAELASFEETWSKFASKR